MHLVREICQVYVICVDLVQVPHLVEVGHLVMVFDPSWDLSRLCLWKMRSMKWVPWMKILWASLLWPWIWVEVEVDVDLCQVVI